MNFEEIMKMATMSVGKEPKVFDWDKAAKILHERDAKNAAAGLREDWGCTCDCILYDGKPYYGLPFLSSTWATPALMVDGCTIDCWRMEHEVPFWDAHTVWPDSALKIFCDK